MNRTVTLLALLIISDWFASNWRQFAGSDGTRIRVMFLTLHQARHVVKRLHYASCRICHIVSEGENFIGSHTLTNKHTKSEYGRRRGRGEFFARRSICAHFDVTYGATKREQNLPKRMHKQRYYERMTLAASAIASSVIKREIKHRSTFTRAKC